MPDSEFYPQEIADKLNQVFVDVAKALDGMHPQQAMEVLAKASGRLIASACPDKENRDKAYTRFGQAVEAHMISFTPYADAYRVFQNTMPSDDTIKN